MLIAHWLKQFLWPSPKARSREVYSCYTSVMGATVLHGKVFGYREEGKIGADNAIYSANQEVEL